MSLPLSLLICLSVFHLCLGTEPVDEVIILKKVHNTGSWFEKSPESKDVQKVAEYAEEMFNKDSEDKELFKLLSVNSAKSQVTNMINYKIIAILGRTKCAKIKNQDLKSCVLDKEQQKCQFVVALNPKKSKYQLNNKICHKYVQKG